MEEQIKKWREKPISWSSINSFREYSKIQWFKTYVLGEKTPSNIYMTFGKEVGDNLSNDNYLPEVDRPQGGNYEYKLMFEIEGKKAIGYIDYFHKDKLILKEFKTGKAWTEEKAKQHGQLKMYALGLMLQDNIKPESLNIELVSLETAFQNGKIVFVPRMKPVTHIVKVTGKDCIDFASEITQTIKEMEVYVSKKLKNI